MLRPMTVYLVMTRVQQDPIPRSMYTKVQAPLTDVASIAVTKVQFFSPLPDDLSLMMI